MCLGVAVLQGGCVHGGHCHHCCSPMVGVTAMVGLPACVALWGVVLSHFLRWLPGRHMVQVFGVPGFQAATLRWSLPGLALGLPEAAKLEVPPGPLPSISFPGPVLAVAPGPRPGSGGLGPILPRFSGIWPGAGFGPYWLWRGR